jgi:thioredoxin reductase (NADPH)
MADWDIVVIGGGAAGLSAAAAVAGQGRSCLVLDPMGGGGELMNLGPLHDVGEAISGPELAARLLEAAVTAGAELGIATVTGLTPIATGWAIATDDGPHTARAVILASGLAPGRLGVAGEADYEGLGVSHCAACDGPLYVGQPVMVVGHDRWAQQEAIDLAETASHVTLVTQGGAAPAVPNVTVIPGRIVALNGAPGLDGVTVEAETGGAPQSLAVPVVFIQTGRRAALDFAPGALVRDGAGSVPVDASMRTNLRNLFAAGELRAGSARTLAAAMEDGRTAAASACAAL